ncbi:hypothetical protein E2C01_059299 [Portunus trituberculatus]|uniref:Uncharacterized protein n=1 Tax=Portunus trituberculatus TaxID=210409 RepID=A0A5B7H7Y2_PORTR|nr:hypothetical protein [Portunus trituberculatus]
METRHGAEGVMVRSSPLAVPRSKGPHSLAIWVTKNPQALSHVTATTRVHTRECIGSYSQHFYVSPPLFQEVLEAD